MRMAGLFQFYWRTCFIVVLHQRFVAQRIRGFTTMHYKFFYSLFTYLHSTYLPASVLSTVSFNSASLVFFIISYYAALDLP